MIVGIICNASHPSSEDIAIISNDISKQPTKLDQGWSCVWKLCAFASLVDEVILDINLNANHSSGNHYALIPNVTTGKKGLPMNFFYPKWIWSINI